MATPVLAGPQADRELTPGEMEEDLFTLSETLWSLHAGRLRYASEEELGEAFGQALLEASEDRTRLEFFRIVSQAVSAVRCGHTRVRFGSVAEREVLDASGLVPFDVLLDGERAWIVHSYDPALEAGTALLAVNGRSIAEIRSTAFARMSGDGFIETGKERQLERDFGRLYVLLVQGPEEVGRPYAVRTGASAEPVTVEALMTAELDERRGVPPPRPLMSVELKPDRDVGIVRISAFGDRPDEKPFPEQLEDCFVKVRESGVHNLVVDLRGNGGGDDNYGALLVSYMATRAFSYFDHIEVTADYDGEGGVVERDGKRLVTEHRSLAPWEPASHRFEGTVYLLQDGWTFSTAADVATVAHYNGFATLVGEESGGGYDGNTSGVTERITLPGSGLMVGVPM